MSRYIHAGSFATPAERQYPDGRNRCDSALKKLFAAGPQRPGSLLKRDRSDVDVNDQRAMLLTKRDRRLRSNADTALQEIKKVHGAGSRPHLDDPKGDAPIISKSVRAVEKARERFIPVLGHRLPSARELNKAFSRRSGSQNVDIDVQLRKVARTVTAGRYDYDFDAKGIVLAKRLNARYAKGLGTARPRTNDVGVADNYGRGAPESLNGQWTDVHANTGASNNFRDIPVPSQRPTIVGSQNTATPSHLTRDAALDAVKMALRKPQRLGARDDNDTDLQDRTDDLDADDADGSDDDRGKNANRDDAFDNRRSAKRGKRRADEDDGE